MNRNVLLIGGAVGLLLLTRSGAASATTTTPKAPTTSAGELLRQAFSTSKVSAAAPTPAPAPSIVQKPANVFATPPPPPPATAKAPIRDITVIGGTEYRQDLPPRKTGKDLAQWEKNQAILSNLRKSYG